MSWSTAADSPLRVLTTLALASLVGRGARQHLGPQRLDAAAVGHLHDLLDRVLRLLFPADPEGIGTGQQQDRQRQHNAAHHVTHNQAPKAQKLDPPPP